MKLLMAKKSNNSKNSSNKSSEKKKQSYIKNLKNSIKNTGLDVASSIMPNLTSAVKSNARFIKTQYTEIKDTIGETDIRDSFLYKSGRDLIKNSLSDIKSGKFNNKERKTINKDDPFSQLLNFDFDSFDNDTDSNIDDAFGSDNDREILKNSSDNNINLDSFNLNLDLDEDTKSDIKTMANFSQASTVVSNRGFATLSKQLSKLIQFQTENTIKFYQNVEEKLNELERHLNISSAYYKDIVTNNEKQEVKGPDKRSLETAYGMNGFKLEDWVDVYTENIKEFMDGFKGISAMMIKPMITEFIDNPLGSLAKNFTKKLIPEGIKNSLKDFDQTFKMLPIMLQSKIPKMKEQGGVMSFFAEILDLNKNRATNKKNEFVKGPISFDGVTKRSITHVIPGYLKRILFAITGEQKDNLVYDMDRGKFITEDDSKKEYKERFEKAPKEVIDNNIDILESNYVKALKENNIIKDESEAGKYIEDLRSSLTQLSKDGKTLSSDLDISDLSMGLKDKESATVLMDVINKLDTRGRNEVNSAMADAYITYQGELRNAFNEERWGSTYDLGSTAKLEKVKEYSFVDNIEDKYDKLKNKLIDDERIKKYKDTIFEGMFSSDEYGRNTYIEDFMDKHLYSRLKGTISDSGKLDADYLKKQEESRKKGKKEVDKLDPDNVLAGINKNTKALQILQMLGIGNISNSIINTLLKNINKDGDPNVIEATINRVISDTLGKKKGLLNKNDLSLYDTLTDEGPAIRVKVVGGPLETIQGVTPEDIVKKNKEIENKINKNEEDARENKISEEIKEIKTVIEDSINDNNKKDKENKKEDERKAKEQEKADREEEKKKKDSEKTSETTEEEKEEPDEEKEKSKFRKFFDEAFEDITGKAFTKEGIEELFDGWVDTNFGKSKFGRVALKWGKKGLGAMASGKIGQALIGKDGIFAKLFNAGDTLASSLANRGKQAIEFVTKKSSNILQEISKRSGVNGKFITDASIEILGRFGQTASNLMTNTAKVINKEMTIGEGIGSLWKGITGTLKTTTDYIKGGTKRVFNLIRNKDIRNEDEKERDSVLEKFIEYDKSKTRNSAEIKDVKPENINFNKDKVDKDKNHRIDETKSGLKIDKEFLEANSKYFYNKKFGANIRNNLTTRELKPVEKELHNMKDSVGRSLENISESVEKSVNKLNDNLTDALKDKVDDSIRTINRTAIETNQTLESKIDALNKSLDKDLNVIIKKLEENNRDTKDLSNAFEEAVDDGTFGPKDQGLVGDMLDGDGDGSFVDDLLTDGLDMLDRKKGKGSKEVLDKVDDVADAVKSKKGIFSKIKNSKLFTKIGNSKVGTAVKKGGGFISKFANKLGFGKAASAAKTATDVASTASNSKGIIAAIKGLGSKIGLGTAKTAGAAAGKAGLMTTLKAGAAKAGGSLLAKGAAAKAGLGAAAKAGLAKVGLGTAAKAGAGAAAKAGLGAIASTGGLASLASVALPVAGIGAALYGGYKLLKKTPKKDKNGNIMYDENGNPIMERGYQKAGRWIKEKATNIKEKVKNSFIGKTAKKANELSKNFWFGKKEVQKDENGNIMYDENGNPIEKRKGGAIRNLAKFTPLGMMHSLFKKNKDDDKNKDKDNKDEKDKKDNKIDILKNILSKTGPMGFLMSKLLDKKDKDKEKKDKKEKLEIKDKDEKPENLPLDKKSFKNTESGMLYELTKKDNETESKKGEESNDPSIRTAAYLKPLGEFFKGAVWKGMFGPAGFLYTLVKGVKEHGFIGFFKKIFKGEDESSTEPGHGGGGSKFGNSSDWDKVFNFVGYEESGNDPARISTGYGDAGGKSYGAYQFSSTMGSADSFANWLTTQNDAEVKKWGERLSQYSAGSTGFDNEWKAIAAENSEKFLEYQQKRMIEAYYDPAINNIKAINASFNPNDYTVALNSLIMSTATQYGPAASIWKKVFGGNYDVTNEEELIRAFRDTRIATFPTTTARYEREYEAAMKLYNTNKGKLFGENDSPDDASGNDVGSRAVQSARKLIGKPYRYGGNYAPLGSSDGTDCSGLMQWAYHDATGVRIPRVTYDQINAGSAVPVTGSDGLGSAKPGDLLFPNKGHVYMYAGNGKIVEAPDEGMKIREIPAYEKPQQIRRMTQLTNTNKKVTNGNMTIEKQGTSDSKKKGVTTPDGTYHPNGIPLKEYLKLGHGLSKYNNDDKNKKSFVKKKEKVEDNKKRIIGKQGTSNEELIKTVTNTLKEINSINKLNTHTKETVKPPSATYKNNNYLDENRNKLILKIKDIVEGIYGNTVETNNILNKILEAILKDTTNAIPTSIVSDSGLAITSELANLFKGF